MGEKSCPDVEFIELVRSVGPQETARRIGVNIRRVYARRRSLESQLGIRINSSEYVAARAAYLPTYPSRFSVAVENGVVLVGSDAHYWPGIVTPAHRAFVKLCKELNPQAVIMNGDAFDGAKISRHPPLGWQKKPDVKDELEAVADRLDEIYQASRNAKHIWTIGNHDARYESRLAAAASEFGGVAGFCLKDNFPAWTHVISTWINNDVVVKHRYKGGIHATHNSTLNAGRSIITGHLHSLKVTPFDDYNGTRWGVDTGSLADPQDPQFSYTEDNPGNHRSGFIVLTFHEGALLWPEVVRVVDENHVEFRGQVLEV